MGNKVCSCVCLESRKQRRSAYQVSSDASNINPSQRLANLQFDAQSNLLFNTVLPVNDIKTNILDILNAIRQLIDNNQNPPQSMFVLPRYADKDEGWIEVMKGLIKFLPEEDPLSPAVINQLVEECPIPSKEIIENVLTTLEIPSLSRKSYFLRNACILLACLAEKMSGPASISLLSNNVLDFLFENLNHIEDPYTLLYSIIALEKFALTAENKSTIISRLKENNPLINYEHFCDETEDMVLRQVGFCSQWSLDNIFYLKDRVFSYLNRDMSLVNALLNTQDVSEYLKLSSSGLEARCDANSFESVRSTLQVSEGAWFYEVTLMSSGIMQIGWATKDSKFLTQEGYGIGDDDNSIAYDGCRQLIWYAANSNKHSHPCWKAGDILGLLLDIENKNVIFSLNGDCLPPIPYLFSTTRTGFYAAASFMSFQQCKFNFGFEEFKYPPKDVSFKFFNEHSTLTNEQKCILPRPLKLLQYSNIKSDENSCILCFDHVSSIELIPCHHRGFCEDCSNILINCPMCRITISGRETYLHNPPNQI